jgi:hypothetical protein
MSTKSDNIQYDYEKSGWLGNQYGRKVQYKWPSPLQIIDGLI